MKTILLVDDIEMNRKILLPIMKNDYVVLEAPSGEDALVILRSNTVDLVITDIFMSPMNGYELIREIRQNEKMKDIPIVAITENDNASQAEAIAAGADAFITRPLESKEFKRIIHRLTGHDFGRRDLIQTDFLLESIPGAVIVYKMHEYGLEVLTCSRGVTTLLDFDADEFSEYLMNPATSKCHPADAPAFIGMIEKILATKSRAELVFRGYKKDGSLIWLWMQGQYIGEEDGLPLLETMLLDISNNTNLYGLLLDQANSMVTVVDAESFEVLYVNEAAKKAAHGVPGELTGAICYQHVFGLNAPCDSCIVNHTKKDSFVYPEKEYHGRYYRQVFKRIKWYSRQAIVDFTYDITEQVKNSRLIEQQKDLQQTILDTIPAGIMVFKFTEEGIKIVSVNKSICEMMGMDREKALGDAATNITMLTHPDDIQIVMDAANKLRTENTSVEYEYRHFFRSRNDYVWVYGQGRSVRQTDGYVYAYVNYTDITARRRAEELQKELDTVASRAAMKSEFYSQMSHDMRTPMNGIMGLAELSKGVDDPQELHDNIDKIYQSGEYLLRLINDSLDFQKFENGGIQLAPKVVCAKELSDSVIQMLKTQMELKNIHLDVQTKDLVPNVYVKTDPLRFKQIFVNLLSNAIKFTPNGGTVSIYHNCLGQTDHVLHDEIIIRDTGIGMSSDFVQHSLFKPFAQEKSDLSEEYTGTGLGLSIVKKLIDLMGGTIKVESELGVGSSFTVHLDIPMASEEEIAVLNEKESSSKPKQEHHLKEKIILLCEDHPLNAEIIKRCNLRSPTATGAVVNGHSAVRQRPA